MQDKALRADARYKMHDVRNLVSWIGNALRCHILHPASHIPLISYFCPLHTEAMPAKIPLLKTSSGQKYLIPYILVTSLFFLWGFAHGLLDVLNKHFQELLTISKAESGLVQFSVYGGYFLAALPAGYFMNRFGYKKGIIFGLLLYAFGAAVFYLAAANQSFWPFLTALLVIAFGLAFLETTKAKEDHEEVFI